MAAHVFATVRNSRCYTRKRSNDPKLLQKHLKKKKKGKRIKEIKSGLPVAMTTPSLAHSQKGSKYGRRRRGIEVFDSDVVSRCYNVMEEIAMGGGVYYDK